MVVSHTLDIQKSKDATKPEADLRALSFCSFHIKSRYEYEVFFNFQQKSPTEITNYLEI